MGALTTSCGQDQMLSEKAGKVPGLGTACMGALGTAKRKQTAWGWRGLGRLKAEAASEVRG